jgi:hypothetical protein
VVTATTTLSFVEAEASSTDEVLIDGKINERGEICRKMDLIRKQIKFNIFVPRTSTNQILALQILNGIGDGICKFKFSRS